MPPGHANIVIFDCDSTLSTIEGIDELARRKGVYEQLAPLTTAAMEGRLRLEDIYKQRLELIRPARPDVEWLGQRYSETLVNDAVPVIDALQRAGKQVHIVSGGIRQAVLQLAVTLGISGQRVHAVDLRFTDAGAYAGYDETAALAKSGGKKVVCRQIVGAQAIAVMVGDGITDLEATQDRIRFIGFGGIVRRPAVESIAPDYITEPTLKPLLALLK